MSATEIGEATLKVVPDFTEFDRAVEERAQQARAQLTEALLAPVETHVFSEAEQEEAIAVRWFSDVAFEGVSTGDGRFMVPGSLGWREPPLTLMAMIETPEGGGHAGAQVAGRMDTFEKDAKKDMEGKALPAGAVAIRATGVFDIDGDRGSDTARMVEDETMRGISVDLAIHEWAFRDPETGEIIDPEEMTDDQWERAFLGDLEFAVLDGEIMAATVCPTPAFADARIAILASGVTRFPKVWKASAEYGAAAGVDEGQLMTTLTAAVIFEAESITAAAVAAEPAAPVAPPTVWFHRPEANGSTPLTITDEGEVYGHIALWDTCHTGFLNGEWSQCIRAPQSATGYAHFHVGEIKTREGDLLPIGKLTYNTGHADLAKSKVAAKCHYDDTGAVGAYVRAKDGEHGIWVCGALRSDISEEGIRDLRANPPSGDWRAVDHRLELIAALAVPVPGFPVPRSQLALAASGDRLEVVALILTASLDAFEEDMSDEAAMLALEIEHGPELFDMIIRGDEILSDGVVVGYTAPE